MPDQTPGSAEPRRQDGMQPRPEFAPRSAGDVSRSIPDLVAAVCPFLVAADGAWRAAAPAREHRCGATDPPSRLPLDRQQSLCLTAAHLDCPLFEAAAGLTAGSHLRDAARAAVELDPHAVPARTAEVDPGLDPGSAIAPAFVDRHRPTPRTTPVILDRARSPLDLHVPQFRMPEISFRRPPAPVGDRVQAADGVPRTRLEELRAVRMRARAEREAAMAPASGGPPDPPGEQASIDAAGLGAVPSMAASMRNPAGREASVRHAGDPVLPEATSRPSRLRTAAVAAPKTAAPIGRLRPSGSLGDTSRFRTTGRIGDSRGRIGALGAAVSGRETQALLAGLLGLALVLLLIVRFSDGGGSSGVAGASSSARPSAAATARPSSAASAIASPSGPIGSAQASPSAAIATPAPSAAPATAAPTPKPTASPTTARTYRVKSGDTLYAIALRFGTTTATLMRLNGITDPRTLRVGQVLKLP